MKVKIKWGAGVIFFYILMFQFSFSLQGQNKIYLTAGAGIPDALHAGLRFNASNVQLGAYVGGLPGSSDRILTLGTDFSFHFAGWDYRHDKRPWFGRVGIYYAHHEARKFYTDNIILAGGAGREISFTDRIGMEFNVGIWGFLYEKKVRTGSSYSGWFDLHFDWPDVLPALGIRFFYKI